MRPLAGGFRQASAPAVAIRRLVPYDFAAMETTQLKPLLADLGARLEALRGYL